MEGTLDYYRAKFGALREDLERIDAWGVSSPQIMAAVWVESVANDHLLDDEQAISRIRNIFAAVREVTTHGNSN